MQSSGSLPAKSDDGVGDLTVNEVDATLGKAMAHSSEFVAPARSSPIFIFLKITVSV